MQSIEDVVDSGSDSAWISLFKKDNVFMHPILNQLFERYKLVVFSQYRSGQILSDIEEYINEDVVVLYSWNNVVNQIPGSLTGLGILGTFVGLILGISEIGFSSVDAALASVQTLLNGINIAFYTSIAGVILSILFNIVSKLSWNVMSRRMMFFINEFHMSIIPVAEDQERFRMQKTMEQVLEKLDRIPKIPGYSISNSSGGAVPANSENAKILMPQIIEGLNKGEFNIVLQPKYDINRKNILAAESFVRWMHPKLGSLSPSVFLPILEENGYITKLDNYVWELVCSSMRGWIDDGVRTVPIAVNISKTDMLAGDVAKIFEDLLIKYRIPRRFIEIEIARNAFIDVADIAIEVTTKLRDKGFKIILDGFNGDFVPLSNIGNIPVDELKLDIRPFHDKELSGIVKSVYNQAKQLNYDISIEGVESAEQVSLLKKCGCAIAQGYYFSKPIQVDTFLEMMKGSNNGG